MTLMNTSNATDAGPETPVTDDSSTDETSPFEQFGPPTPTREEVVEAMLTANTQVDIERDLGLDTESTRKLVYGLRKAGHDVDVNCTIYGPLDRETVEAAVASFVDGPEAVGFSTDNAESDEGSPDAGEAWGAPTETTDAVTPGRLVEQPDDDHDDHGQRTAANEASDVSPTTEPTDEPAPEPPIVTGGMRRPAAVRVAGERTPFGIPKIAPTVDLDAVPEPPADPVTEEPASTDTAGDDSVDVADIAYESLNNSARDVLRCLARLERAGERTHTAGIKRELERRLGESIAEGRIHYHLDPLLDAGLIEREAYDGRSYAYSLSDRGIELLVESIASTTGDVAALDSFTATHEQAIETALTEDQS